MNSLQDLNNYGSTIVNYDDQRDPTVKFTSFEVANIAETILDLEFPAQYSVDVEEIIRPDIANCYYVIDVSAVPGATVTWDTVPSGLIAENPSPGVYVIGYIQSPAQWDIVKTPTITAPAGFQGAFIYSSYVFWTENDGAHFIAWNVGNYIPVSLQESEFALSSTAKRTRTSIISVSSSGTLECAPNAIVYTIGSASLSAISTVLAEGAKARAILSAVLSNLTYSTNVNFSITGAPTIVDIPDVNENQYSVSITPSVPSGITSISMSLGSATYAGGYDNPVNSDDNDFGINGFGTSIASNTNYVMIGHRTLDVGTKNNQGVVWLFSKSTNTLARTVNSPIDRDFEWFGAAVAMSESYYLIGAPGYDYSTQSQTGRAYLYDVASGTLLYTFEHPERTSYDASNNVFGKRVAVNEDYSLIGVDREPGGLWVFNNSTGSVERKLSLPNTTNYLTFCDTIGLGGKYAVIVANYSTDSFVTVDPRLLIYDITTGDIVSNISKPSGASLSWGGVIAVCETWVAVKDSGLSTDRLHIYNIKTGALLRTISLTNISDITINNNHVTVVDGSTGNIRMYNINTGSLTRTISKLNDATQGVYMKGNTLLVIGRVTSTGKAFVHRYTISGGQAYFTFNNTTKVATLTGSLETINATINSSLTVDPETTYTGNFNLTYTAQDIDGVEGFSRVQTVTRV